MRILAVLLLIAVAFGAAAAWQSRKVAALHAERAHAEAIREGRVAETPSGAVPAGWAVVTVGRPSGRSREAAEAASEGDIEAHSDDESSLEAVEEASFEPDQESMPSTETLDDAPSFEEYELVVDAGQTLYQITSAHYGSAPQELVDALAGYNGLVDASEIGVGTRLRLPPIDVLLER